MAKTKYVDPSVAIDVLKPIVFTIEKQFYGASQVDRCWLVIAESESPAKIMPSPSVSSPESGANVGVSCSFSIRSLITTAGVKN